MDTKKKNIVVCVLFALLLAAAFLMCVFYPKAKFSESERRKLAAMPELSVKTVLNGKFMSDFETYAQDTFPFRDSFRALKALTATQVFHRQDNNGIYVHDGFAAAMEYPMKEQSLDRAVQRMRYLCEKYLTEQNKVYFSVIPDKNRFLAQPSGHLSMDYTLFEQMMRKKADFASYIGISDLLERDDFYKTDTHWRQEKIVDVAERLAGKMGVSLAESYTEQTLAHEFNGVYSGQSALPLPPDTIHYLISPEMQDYKVYDWQNSREMGVYDMERAVGKDPYEIFLSGPLSLVTIENPHAKTDRELVLVRDSFGSSIAPLLAGGYAKLTLVDIRYIHPDQLARFVDFSNCDVLFLYSTLVLNNSETFK